jgi:hypothetical protein
MEPPNTYTYRQSELPPMTDEIQSEIAEINFNVANLILKIQGNYYALTALTETLADGLKSAESNLCSIRIIPDDGEPKLSPRAIGFTDLPIAEKQLIVSTGVISTVAVKMIATFLGCSLEQAIAHVSGIGEEQIERMSPQQVEQIVAELAKTLHEQPDKSIFVIQS